jgi:sigma54-dependent transcription regulator
MLSNPNMMQSYHLDFTAAQLTDLKRAAYRLRNAAKKISAATARSGQYGSEAARKPEFSVTVTAPFEEDGEIEEDEIEEELKSFKDALLDEERRVCS